MCFEVLYEAERKGELILVDGGLCRYHLRRDGQLTIHELISQRPGIGSALLARLMAVPGAMSLLAKCPADLAANEWYARRGFVLEATETTKNGRKVHTWRRVLN